VLKKGGFLNPKYPGGTEQQGAYLASVGMRASLLRCQIAVFDYRNTPALPIRWNTVIDRLATSVSSSMKNS